MPPKHHQLTIKFVRDLFKKGLAVPNEIVKLITETYGCSPCDELCR